LTENRQNNILSATEEYSVIRKETAVAFHHVSLVTRDLTATHRFYTELMGFELAKVQCGPTPDGAGWSRLVFYDTGGDGMMSFWDLHDETIGSNYPTDLSSSLGLPIWVNHLAFDAATLEDLEHHKQRWRENGVTVTQIDWGNSVSIYTVDPNGILVEFSCTRGSFTTPEDRSAAPARLTAEQPSLDPRPSPEIFPPVGAAQH
jgi:catechol 2,3-dioxygenase-like lactoylglutathione lyase family enzyme